MIRKTKNIIIISIQTVLDKLFLFFLLLVFLILFFVTVPVIKADCEGHFVNPFTDVCWDCLFPITIGNINVVSGDYPDTDNPSLPVEVCKINVPPYMRIGLNIGFWEPFALADVTPTPYCMVNLVTERKPMLF